MNVGMSSCNEQTANSYDDDNANNNSDMQHDTRTSVGIERLCFPFSGKHGINVDLEDRNNPLEYFELFITPESARLISRETNWHIQQFLENNSDL
jgi:hypothetical protein